MVNKNSNKAIVLLTRYPDNIWLNFLNNFHNYDIFIVIDDITTDFSKLFNIKNSKINFIQIDDNYCKSKGFHNAVHPTGNLPNKVLAWDKALMYFCLINNYYDYVWFLEDDVFILKEDVLINIDSKYSNSDLLTSENYINNNGDLSTWELWFTVKDKLNLPWCKSMTCACRISNKLLNIINNYVKNNNTLQFHEAMFNTLAYQNNCLINNPKELENIHYRTGWDIYNLDLNKIYHPIKELYDHVIIRQNNMVYFDNLFNNVNWSNATDFYFSEYEFLRKNLVQDFNFCCYRENNDFKGWNDEGIVWHWFTYGRYENRQYKD